MNNRLRLQKDFSVVPDELIRDPEVDAYGIALYMALMMYASSKTDTAWPSHDTLRAHLSCSRDTIIRRQRVLIERGWISVEQRTGTSNLYTINQIRSRSEQRVAVSDTPSRSEQQGDVAVSDTNHIHVNQTQEPDLTGANAPVHLSGELSVRKGRDPNVFFDAVIAAFGPVTDRNRGVYGKLAALAKAEGHPDVIQQRAALHLAAYDFALTPNSLVKRWDELAGDAAKLSALPHKERQRMLQRQQESQANAAWLASLEEGEQ